MGISSAAMKAASSCAAIAGSQASCGRSTRRLPSPMSALKRV